MPISVIERYSEEQFDEVWNKRGPGTPRIDQAPYLAAVRELENHPTITIEVGEGELKSAKLYLQRASRQTWDRGLIFRRLMPDSNRLTFRLQSDDERESFYQRGMKMAEARNRNRSTALAQEPARPAKKTRAA